MKTKLIPAAVALMIGSLAVYFCVRWVLNSRAEEAERQRFRQATRDAVTELATRHDAVTDWEERLSKGESRRSSRILGIELEQYWRRDRPILFVGCIRDVSSDGADAYQVEVDKDYFSMGRHSFDTEFRLMLRAPRSTIDLFLQQHPEAVGENTPASGVAVVAKIASISSTGQRDAEGDVVQKKTGHGELLGIVYTRDLYYGSRPSSRDED